MKEGKKVRIKTWYTIDYIYYDKNEEIPEKRIKDNNENIIEWLSIIEFESNNWEVYEESKKTLSDKSRDPHNNGSKMYSHNNVKKAIQEFLEYLYNNDDETIVIERKAEQIFGEELIK